MKNIFEPNYRIVILQGINNDPGYSLSNEMLQRLLKSYGHTLSIAEVNVQINWLEQRGFVIADRLENGLVIVKITRPGQDLATGFSRVEGVDPPPLD